MFSKTLAKKNTPWVAAIFVFALSALLLPIGKIETVASVSAFVTMIAFIAVNIAIVALRITSPNLNRPFRVHLSIYKIPMIPILGIIVCMIFILQFKSEVYLISLAAMICSFGAYFLYGRTGRSASSF